jgi:hypothetical protein
MCAMHGTSIEELLAEARRQKPDYSSKLPSIPGDQKILTCPRIIGQLLALKAVYKRRAQEATSEDDRQFYFDTRNLLGMLADREFKCAIRTMQYRNEMHLRSNGEIMRTRPAQSQQAA